MKDLTETTLSILLAVIAILTTYLYFSSTLTTLINNVVQQFPR